MKKKDKLDRILDKITRDDYYNIKEGSTPNLRKIFEARARIPRDLWNYSSRDDRLRIFDRLIGPLNLVGKLDDAELDYLEECKFYTMVEYLTSNPKISDGVNEMTAYERVCQMLAGSRIAEATIVAREETQKNIARALLKEGVMSVDEIVEFTGLDLNTVLHLQGE